MLESVEDGAKNRLATVFFYLNNVSSGGETNFPRAASERWPDGAPTPRDYFDCSQGLSVYPAEGKVIIFYNMLPSGEMDELSLHGGCDVLKETETSTRPTSGAAPPAAAPSTAHRLTDRPPPATQAVEQAVPLPSRRRASASPPRSTGAGFSTCARGESVMQYHYTAHAA